MRPVDLTPPKVGAGKSDVKVGSAPSQGALVMLIVFVAGFGAAAYGGWAYVSGMKGKAAKLTQESTALQAQAAQVQAQIAEKGQTDDFTKLASAVQQQVFTALGERYDFAEINRQVTSIIPSNAWITALNVAPGGATAGGSGSDSPISIDGYATDLETVDSLVKRLNALVTVSGATMTAIKNEQASDGTTVYSFTIGGQVEGAEASGTGTDTTNLVAKGGTTASELSLDPDPSWASKQKAVQKKQAAASAPVSSLDSIAAAASKAGGD